MDSLGHAPGVLIWDAGGVRLWVAIMSTIRITLGEHSVVSTAVTSGKAEILDRWGSAPQAPMNRLPRGWALDHTASGGWI